MTKVSVVIPVYKVEKFIARCAESLMEQTLEDVEYIFVDDKTPDGSIALVESVIGRYPHRKNNVRIIRHEENQGLPAARNTGLEVATGEYVFHCDSDDFVEPDMLQTMYETAISRNADIVWCDWFLSFDRTERYMKQPSFDTPADAVRAMLGGKMKFNVWNKLVRRGLYDTTGIRFPSGYGMGEDMTMIMLFSQAERVAYVSRAFYHYVKTNTNAFSQTYSDRHLAELRYNVSRVDDYLSGKFGDRFKDEISYMKLEAKFPFLLSDDPAKLKLWTEWYTEANTCIMSNKNISLRSRLLQWCAWKGQFWIVRVYGCLLNKVVYGMIYK